MKKEYESPDFAIVRISLYDVLGPSKQEVIATEGHIEEPEILD